MVFLIPFFVACIFSCVWWFEIYG